MGKCCEGVLWRSVVVMEKIVVEKCWRTLLFGHRSTDKKYRQMHSYLDYDRSISVERVNIRVRGFHLFF